MDGTSDHKKGDHMTKVELLASLEIEQKLKEEALAKVAKLEHKLEAMKAIFEMQ
jgi:hypothetical protein